MKNRIASRMDKLLPSGIRKVNEKALAMEREGKTSFILRLDVRILIHRIT